MRYDDRMPYSDPARQREYQNEWMKRRRQEWLDENGPCIDCGTWDDLQVDHVDAAVKMTHRIWSWSAERRVAELAKCVVRCDPCHRVKTVRAGERARGERNGLAKLTEDKVRAIRASDLPHRELARLYEIDEKNIRLIRLNAIWKHVE